MKLASTFKDFMDTVKELYFKDVDKTIEEFVSFLGSIPYSHFYKEVHIKLEYIPQKGCVLLYSNIEAKCVIKNNDINYCRLVLKDALRQFAFDYKECITLSADEIVIKPIIK